MLHFIYIFSTNISTEYFKHAAHSPFFSSECRLFHNATFFCFSVLFKFYVQDVLKFKCKTPVRGSVHHSTNLIEKPNKMQQFIKVLLYLILKEAQHVSGDRPPIIRGQNCTSSLWFLHNTVEVCWTFVRKRMLPKTSNYFKWSSTCFGRHATHHQEPKTTQAASGFCIILWKVVRRAVVGRLSGSVCNLKMSNNCKSDNLPQYYAKTRGCICSFRLLMMGGVSPKTCWASFKIRNNKILINCYILFGFTTRILLTVLLVYKVVKWQVQHTHFKLSRWVILNYLEYTISVKHINLL
jgi:hypothetical protein